MQNQDPPNTTTREELILTTLLALARVNAGLYQTEMVWDIYDSQTSES